RSGVSAEQCVGPVRREEDITGSLYLRQQFERRAQVLLGRCAAQRMIQVGERIGDPRLAAAVGGVGQTSDEIVTDCVLRRYRGHHDLEARAAIRVLEALALSSENVGRVRNAAKRKRGR